MRPGTAVNSCPTQNPCYEEDGRRNPVPHLGSAGLPATRPAGQRRYKGVLPEKSRNQKTAAWILLGGGAAITLGNAIWLAGRDPSRFDGSGVPIETVMSALGLGAITASIPLFIASGRNANKAVSLAFKFKMERAPVPAVGQISLHPFPVLALRLPVK